MPRVSIVIGSASDKELGDKAKAVLDEFGIESEVKILSAHRNPVQLQEYVEVCGAQVFIAIAGLSAALPGSIAARTTRPVIGVPKDAKLGGLDSLLSIVQMPRGVPVACMAIDGAENAGVFAAQILALADQGLEKKMSEYRGRWTTH